MKVSKKEAELLLCAIRPLRNQIINFCDKETKEALNSIEMKLRDNLKLNINYEKREFEMEQYAIDQAVEAGRDGY